MASNTQESTTATGSKRKEGTPSVDGGPKQKRNKRLESKARILDPLNFPRTMQKGQSPVWSFGNGFSIYNSSKLEGKVVCETCVQREAPDRAEFSFNSSSGNVESHIKHQHKGEEWEGYLLSKATGGAVGKSGKEQPYIR